MADVWGGLISEWHGFWNLSRRPTRALLFLWLGALRYSSRQGPLASLKLLLFAGRSGESANYFVPPDHGLIACRLSGAFVKEMAELGRRVEADQGQFFWSQLAHCKSANFGERLSFLGNQEDQLVLSAQALLDVPDLVVQSSEF